MEFIPNMDGFPNGRRLEDDVTRIELQAVSGFVLAALGLWYDDFVPGGSPVTPDLLSVYNYTTGVGKNDAAFLDKFPYEAPAWSGKVICDCGPTMPTEKATTMNSVQLSQPGLGIAPPEVVVSTSPNPIVNNNTLRYMLDADADVRITLYNSQGQAVKVLANAKQTSGVHTINWQAGNLGKGTYFIQVMKNGDLKKTLTVVKQ